MYPILEQAIATAVDGYAAADALPRGREQERALGRVYRHREETTYPALAAELLPAIFPGRAFVKTPHHVSNDSGWIFGVHLIDHRCTWRVKGMRGPTTWRNSILTSEPYRCFIDGLIRPEAVSAARNFAQHHGVTVWARPDLSPWFPGHTSLFLIGRLLADRDPAAFGFTLIAGGNPPPADPTKGL